LEFVRSNPKLGNNHHQHVFGSPRTDFVAMMEPVPAMVGRWRRSARIYWAVNKFLPVRAESFRSRPSPLPLTVSAADGCTDIAALQVRFSYFLLECICPLPFRPDLTPAIGAGGNVLLPFLRHTAKRTMAATVGFPTPTIRPTARPPHLRPPHLIVRPDFPEFCLRSKCLRRPSGIKSLPQVWCMCPVWNTLLPWACATISVC